MKKIISALFICICSMSVMAAQDFYLFKSDEDKSRFNQLTNEFRCLVCQNQTIADSNAALASDLRNQIFDKIQQGQSDQQIIQYLTSRYGDFILYKPPLNFKTLILWFGPFALLFIGAGYLFVTIRQRQHANSV
jgi:cytochrome c-type biogenesis protein CcmH